MERNITSTRQLSLLLTKISLPSICAGEHRAAMHSGGGGAGGMQHVTWAALACLWWARLEHPMPPLILLLFFHHTSPQPASPQSPLLGGQALTHSTRDKQKYLTDAPAIRHTNPRQLMQLAVSLLSKNKCPLGHYLPFNLSRDVILSRKVQQDSLQGWSTDHNN